MATTAIRPLEIAGQPAVQSRHAGGQSLEAFRRWHLLSLDAPSVAAVWFLLFSAAETWRIRLPEAAALAIAVWLLYVADRVLDATRGDAAVLQARHFFHLRQRWWFAAAAGMLMPVLAWLVLRLPSPVCAVWVWLALPMGVYATAVHLWPVRRLPKELVVSLMFALATALPALSESQTHQSRIVLAGTLFAVVCWLNGLAIARWEGSSGRPRLESRSTRWGARHLYLLCLCVACMGVALAGVAGWPAAACAASAVLLVWLDRTRASRDAVAQRALADAALLTPLLGLFWL